jgi:hypothetical protein
VLPAVFAIGDNIIHQAGGISGIEAFAESRALQKFRKSRQGEIQCPNSHAVLRLPALRL